MTKSTNKSPFPYFDFAPVIAGWTVISSGSDFIPLDYATTATPLKQSITLSQHVRSSSELNSEGQLIS